MELEKSTDEQWPDAVIWWGFFPMSSHHPYCSTCHLSFQPNTVAPLSLPCSSILAARYLFICRGHLALTSVCHAACQDRAGADSQLLCHRWWLHWATVHSLAGHSCLHYLLRALSERKCSAGQMRAHLPYTLQICSKGVCKNYKVCIQTKKTSS